MSIDPHDCSPSTVAQEVSESVGFDVILLDSKYYPLLDNAATSIISFWKSTRKILAASKSILQKLSVGSLDLKRDNDEVDLTQRMKSCHHLANIFVPLLALSPLIKCLRKWIR